ARAGEREARAHEPEEVAAREAARREGRGTRGGIRDVVAIEERELARSRERERRILEQLADGAPVRAPLDPRQRARPVLACAAHRACDPPRRYRWQAVQWVIERTP